MRHSLLSFLKRNLSVNSNGLREDWLQTDLTIEFLGTSSSRPTATRNVSSLALHHRSGTFLFDCGDGTIRQIFRSQIFRPQRVEGIFITHLHMDHFYGLPAVASTIGLCSNEFGGVEQVLSNARKPVFGPKGLKRLMGNLVDRCMEIREIHHTPGFPKYCDNSLPISEHIIYENKCLLIAAMTIRHSVTCFGYIIEEKSSKNIDSVRLLIDHDLKPGEIYKKLLNMEPVVSPKTGQLIIPENYVQINPGRRIIVLGDTYDPSNIAPYALNCDLLVHEATGVEADRSAMLMTKHSTGGMAGEFAKIVKAKHLVLTHFSPRNNVNGVVSDDRTYQVQVLEEAKLCAGSDITVTAAHDHLAIPIPRNH